MFPLCLGSFPFLLSCFSFTRFGWDDVDTLATSPHITFSLFPFLFVALTLMFLFFLGAVRQMAILPAVGGHFSDFSPSLGLRFEVLGLLILSFLCMVGFCSVVGVVVAICLLVIDMVSVSTCFHSWFLCIAACFCFCCCWCVGLGFSFVVVSCLLWLLVLFLSLCVYCSPFPLLVVVVVVIVLVSVFILLTDLFWGGKWRQNNEDQETNKNKNLNNDKRMIINDSNCEMMMMITKKRGHMKTVKSHAGRKRISWKIWILKGVLSNKQTHKNKKAKHARLCIHLVAFHPRQQLASDFGRNITRSSNLHWHRKSFPSRAKSLAFVRKMQSSSLFVGLIF